MPKKEISKSSDANLYEVLAQLIVQTRESQHLGQAKVSNVLGESRNFMFKTENMQRRFDVVELYRFAKALSIDPVELFSKFVQLADATSPAE